MVNAAYRPGEGLDRVSDSLDAQTLPQDRFETIIVDDGSPDDTYERLQRLAAERPNMRVHRIENSGWPSRPRNVATDMARGEWVLFMDHDDSLFPDALRAVQAPEDPLGALGWFAVGLVTFIVIGVSLGTLLPNGRAANAVVIGPDPDRLLPGQILQPPRPA